MAKFVVCGTERYFSEMSLASALMRCSSCLRAAATASASPVSIAARRCS